MIVFAIILLYLYPKKFQILKPSLVKINKVLSLVLLMPVFFGG